MTILGRRSFIGSGVAAVSTSALPGFAFATTPVPPPRDLTILLQALDLHPGLTRYWNGPAVSRTLYPIGLAWPEGDSRARFLALARFLARLRCGHSYPNFFNQRRPVQEELFGNIPQCLSPSAGWAKPWS